MFEIHNEQLYFVYESLGGFPYGKCPIKVSTRAYSY